MRWVNPNVHGSFYRSIDLPAPPARGTSALGRADAMPDFAIERINILRASLLAMRRAVAALGIMPDIALVDGNVAPPLPCPVKTVVKGDSLSFSIAAASVVAKVTRDRIMRGLAGRYPGYGWATNVGYSTAEHFDGIGRLGVTPHHRRSFEPVRLALSGTADLLTLLEAAPLAAADD